MQNSLIFKSFIGVDVSKDKLDVFNSVTGELTQVKNNATALDSFVKSLSATDELLVVVDLTGGYEELCVQTFYSAGFHVHRAEGVRVKAFLRAMNQKAKTDAIDAAGLAQYGEKMQENLLLYTPSHNELKSPVERLCDLKNMLQVERNRFQAPAQKKSALKSINRHVKFLEGEIAKLEKEAKAIIKADEELTKRQKVMVESVGVGEATSIILLAHMPELGHTNRRVVAALSGLAPFARDSGKTTGHRTTKGCGGRPQVKKALFMCALVAIKHDPKMKEFYERLCGNGKKKKVAIVAVMRKIIVALNAKIKILYQAS